MADDSLLIELSAYADGELDAEVRRLVEARLAAEPQLQRQLAIFKRLDQAALAVPVPQASAEAWSYVAERTVSPSAEDEHAMKLSAIHDGERTDDLSAGAEAERLRRIWARLDAEAAALAVPSPSDALTDKVLAEVAARTVKITDVDQRVWQRMQEAALAVPAVDESKYQRVWQAISQRIALAAPAVPESRFDVVWKGVQAKMEVSRPKEASARVVAADFKQLRRRRWRWAIAACAAVALMVLGTFMLTEQPASSDEGLAMEIPEAADDDYQVHVKYVAGQREPIVCFLPKSVETQPKLKAWRWLPY